MKTILITGGAGFIGSHLADALLQENHHIRIYDSLIPQVHDGEQNRWPAYLNKNCETIQGDVRNREQLKLALRGVDVVYHLAARVGVGQSMYEIQGYSDVNIGGTATLLDIIVNESPIRDRIAKVVLASSMSNYGEGAYRCPIHGTVAPSVRSVEQLSAKEWEMRCPGTDENDRPCSEPLTPVPTSEAKQLEPMSIYAITKKTQEEMCLVTGRTYGIPMVGLRFFNTYGSRQALSNPYTGVLAIFCSRLLNQKSPLIYEDGQQVRDFVHVSDLVQAARLVMDHPEATDKVFNVGTGQPITIREIAVALAEYMDVPVAPQLTQQARSGDIRHCYADIEQLKGLGYRPKMTFEDGLDELVEWVSSQIPADSFEKAQEQLVTRGLAV
ncbi:MAG: NAD-dependent epimerase/dehydratase family protein [Chloroflexota bacterium]